MIGGGSGFFIARQTLSTRSAYHSSPESHALLIERLHALGEMELLSYQVRDVVRKEWEYPLPFTRSRLLLVVAGEARICMDFTQVKVLKADWKGRVLRLRLPSPTLCVVRVDPTASQVYDANFSIIEWWQGGEAERVREALSAAQETLRVRLSREFPTIAARRQAETLLRSLCQSMGWHSVEFTEEG
ncbi:MAG: DUF4230 domain-containing protein [Bacteroidia bacterium]|nr:DUF4230 domain-containing protein [Bacteroidia bacterium]